MDLLCFSVLCLLCLCARLFICALWLPAGKGLASWLSFVVSNCEFVTSPLVSWSSIGAGLAPMTSLPVQDGDPHDFRSKMATPTTPRWRPPRRQIQDGDPHGVRSKVAAPRSQIRDGGPCDAFGYTSEGESTP